MRRAVGVGAVVMAMLLLAGRAHAQPEPTPDPEPAPTPVPAPAPEPVPAAVPEVAAAPTAPPKPPEAVEARTAEVAAVPPAEAEGPTFQPVVTVYAEYAFSLRHDAAGEADWFHVFDLPRAHLGTGVAWEAARGRVVLEAVRSSSEGALLGVAGDSLVARFRDAWLGVKAWDVLEVRAGLVPTLVLPAIEQSWALRAIAPTAVERAGFLSPADLGASVRAHLPDRWGWVGVEAANGDGYARRELNRGKNVEIAAEIHPVPLEDARAFGVLASYTAGSRGVGLARSDRLTGGLVWNGAWFRAGGVFTWAHGVADDGDRSAIALEGFVKVAEIPAVPRLIVATNVAVLMRDLDVQQDVVTTIIGAIGARIAPPLAAYVAAEGAIHGDAAADALPERDDLRLRLVGELSLPMTNLPETQ